MRAVIDDTTSIDNQDSVRANHRRQAVRDDKVGTALHQVRERGLNIRLGVRVKRGCRIIQNENPWVGQNRACDSHPLFLTAAELNAILADLRLVAIRELHDKAVHIGGFGCGDNIGIRGILAPVPNIFLQRHGKEQRLL